MQGADGNFYGTAAGGGINGGTVFKVTPSGTLTTLYGFCSQGPPCADGEVPFAGLIQASDGNFYGTTSGGVDTGGYGTIFNITPSGTLTTLYGFCSQGPPCADGAEPFAALIQASDGNFYGTTVAGGANEDHRLNSGTIFKITPTGTLTTLYSFCSQANCADGAAPQAGLIQASDGNFYGTTYYGGPTDDGFISGSGTIFKIPPGGTLTTLYSFCSQVGCADGAEPSAGLIQASDGNFYGTTSAGGKDLSRNNLTGYQNFRGWIS